MLRELANGSVRKTVVPDNIGAKKGSLTKVIKDLITVFDGVLSFHGGYRLFEDLIYNVEGVTLDDLVIMYNMADDVADLLLTEHIAKFDLMTVPTDNTPLQTYFDKYLHASSKDRAKYRCYFRCLVFEDMLKSSLTFCLNDTLPVLSTLRSAMSAFHGITELKMAIERNTERRGMSFESYMIFLKKYPAILMKTIFATKKLVLSRMKSQERKPGFLLSLNTSGKPLEKWLFNRSSNWCVKWTGSTNKCQGMKDYFPKNIYEHLEQHQHQVYLENEYYSKNEFVLPDCLSVKSILKAVFNEDNLDHLSFDITSANEGT